MLSRAANEIRYFGEDSMKLVFGLSLVFAVAAQCASAAKTPPPLHAENKADFDKVVVQIRSEMQTNGRFGKLSDKEREGVEGDLRQMSDLFDKTPELNAMSDGDKRALFNAQEAANATLLKRDGDRLICVNEARSGTHFKSTTCRTVRDIERDREGSHDWMERLQQSPNGWNGN